VKVYSRVMRTPLEDVQERETDFFSPSARKISSEASDAKTGCAGKTGWLSSRYRSRGSGRFTGKA
jgi:hypothetical protein